LINDDCRTASSRKSRYIKRPASNTQTTSVVAAEAGGSSRILCLVLTIRRRLGICTAIRSSSATIWRPTDGRKAGGPHYVVRSSEASYGFATSDATGDSNKRAGSIRDAVGHPAPTRRIRRPFPCLRPRATQVARPVQPAQCRCRERWRPGSPISYRRLPSSPRGLNLLDICSLRTSPMKRALIPTVKASD
jgi:hypothetical protein